MFSPPSERLDALTPSFLFTSQREEEIAILAGNFYLRSEPDDASEAAAHKSTDPGPL